MVNCNEFLYRENTFNLTTSLEGTNYEGNHGTNIFSSEYTTWAIFKVTPGPAFTEEIMRKRFKDEWLPFYNR